LQIHVPQIFGVVARQNNAELQRGFFNSHSRGSIYNERALKT